MPRFLSCALSALTCINLFCATAGDAQSQRSSPVVVLEATNTIHANNNYQEQWLLVRLTNDGNVEWDKAVGNAWERQTSIVSAERVAEIEQTLTAIDRNALHGKMGPYHIEEDASVELQIHMTVRQAEFTFSVMNPWLPSASPRHKPMPKNVRAVVCEIDKLHAELANISVNELCRSGQPSR